MDTHADRRDAQRQKRRFGPTTTNPGLRIVQRELAVRAQLARICFSCGARNPTGHWLCYVCRTILPREVS